MTDKTPDEVVALAKRCGAIVQHQVGGGTIVFFREVEELQAFAALMSAQPVQPAALPVLDYYQLVNNLMSHLEDVLDDEAWESIDVKQWNAVTSHLKVSQPAALPADCDVEAATKAAFASSNDCPALSLHKHWYGKGYREGFAANITQPATASALEQAHQLGFLRCAGWVQRDDLFSDTSSEAYRKDRAHDLSKLAQSVQPAPF